MNTITMDVDWQNNPIKVVINGVIDSFNSENALENFCDIADKTNSSVCLDLSSVNFIDSTSIGAIVHFFKKLRCKQLDLSIVGLHEQPFGLFTLLGLDKMIHCQKA